MVIADGNVAAMRLDHDDAVGPFGTVPGEQGQDAAQRCRARGFSGPGSGSVRRDRDGSKGLRAALAIFRKDLLLEMRGKEVVVTLAVFSFLVLTVFSFSAAPGSMAPREMAPYLPPRSSAAGTFPHCVGNI